jgi:hypothetical protein
MVEDGETRTEFGAGSVVVEWSEQVAREPFGKYVLARDAP